MRMWRPWQRGTSDEDGAGGRGDEGTEQGGEMGRDYTRDEWDDEDTNDPEEDETGDEDEEGSGDAAASAEQAQREAMRLQLRSEVLQEIHGSLQEVGFGLGMDGRPVIADRSKVAAFAGSLAPAPRQAENPAAAGNDEDEEIPDPVSDPAGHRSWMQAQIQKGVAAAVQGFQQRVEAQDAWRLDSAKERAVERFKALVPGSNLGQLGLSQENAAAVLQEFRGLLETSDARHWNDDESLLMLGGAAVMKVMPKGGQPRGAAGRFASPRGVNATVFDQSWEPHPDAGRLPRESRPSREEVEAARASGMSVGQYRALSGSVTTLADYERSLAADEKARKKG